MESRSEDTVLPYAEAKLILTVGKERWTNIVFLTDQPAENTAMAR